MSTTRQRFNVTGLPEDLEIPFFEFRGNFDGPSLTLIAGIHGCEYTGMAALRRFSAEIDPAQLHGSITIVPIVALPSFRASVPFVVPQDGKNLNRNFPGRPDGSYTEVLAHQVFDRFFVGSDYLVDLHAGDIGEKLEAMTIYDESAVQEEASVLARVFGTKHVIRQPSGARTVAGTTSAAAADAGIPAFVAESGGNGLLDEGAISVHLQGLRNVTGHLEMLPFTVVPTLDQAEHSTGWDWLRSPVEGWWEPTLRLGARVDAGTVLGHVGDLFGKVLHEVRAPEVGIPLIQATNPSVGPETLLVAIARPAN